MRLEHWPSHSSVLHYTSFQRVPLHTNVSSEFISCLQLSAPSQQVCVHVPAPHGQTQVSAHSESVDGQWVHRWQDTKRYKETWRMHKTPELDFPVNLLCTSSSLSAQSLICLSWLTSAWSVTVPVLRAMGSTVARMTFPQEIASLMGEHISQQAIDIWEAQVQCEPWRGTYPWHRARGKVPLEEVSSSAR